MLSRSRTRTSMTFVRYTRPVSGASGKPSACSNGRASTTQPAPGRLLDSSPRRAMGRSFRWEVLALGSMRRWSAEWARRHSEGDGACEGRGYSVKRGPVAGPKGFIHSPPPRPQTRAASLDWGEARLFSSRPRLGSSSVAPPTKARVARQVREAAAKLAPAAPRAVARRPRRALTLEKTARPTNAATERPAFTTRRSQNRYALQCAAATMNAKAVAVRPSTVVPRCAGLPATVRARASQLVPIARLPRRRAVPAHLASNFVGAFIVVVRRASQTVTARGTAASMEPASHLGPAGALTAGAPCVKAAPA
jgi:hypothetical protein